MSEQWAIYSKRFQTVPSVIRFDEGLNSEIDALPHPLAAKLHATIKAPNKNGFPSQRESDALIALEDAILPILDKHKAVLMGVETSEGKRIFHALLHEDSSIFREELNVIGAASTYALMIEITQDTARESYWTRIWPSPDDRCVMNDENLLRQLASNGDETDKPRPVDHWAYFPDERAADTIIADLNKQDYGDIEKSQTEDDAQTEPPTWRVTAKHFGTMELNDITSHTLSWSRRARELGGYYDGWATYIIKPEDADN